MTDFNKWLELVKEWDNEGKTSWLITVTEIKADAVRFANLVRNKGYIAEIDPSDGWYYQIKIGRKNKIRIIKEN